MRVDMWILCAVAYALVAGVAMAAAVTLAPPNCRADMVFAAFIWPLLAYAVVRLAVRLVDGPAKEGGSPC